MNKLQFINSLTPDQSKVVNQILEEEIANAKKEVAKSFISKIDKTPPNLSNAKFTDPCVCVERGRCMRCTDLSLKDFHEGYTDKAKQVNKLAQSIINQSKGTNE